MSKGSLRFVSAQPDSPWFVWQVHICVQSLLDVGVAAVDITSLFGVEPDAEPTHELEALRARFPDVDIRTMTDDRSERARRYPPSIQPYLIKRWLREAPDRSRRATLYHDCDIALRRLPDVAAMHRDPPEACLLSDAVSYVGYGYLHERCEIIREERPELPEDDLIRRMCDVVGIDVDRVRAEQASSGGAQYLLRDVGADYWAKVYDDSVALRELFDDYVSELELKHDPAHYLQVRTAGMWAYLWNLWYFGHTTVVHEELGFLFSADTLDSDSPIILMAGTTAESGTTSFDKSTWLDLNPIEVAARQPYVFDHFSPGSVSAEYARHIHTAAGSTPVGVCDPDPAQQWRVLAWQAGTHGDIWDVERLSLRFDRDVEIIDHLESGSAGPGFEPANAFRDDSSIWGGRTVERPGELPEFYLGVELDRPAMPTTVMLRHPAGDHRATLALVQYRVDGGDWVTTEVCPLPRDRSWHTLLYRPTGVDAAPAWRLVARSASGQFAWDVRQVRFLHHGRELHGAISGSGSAGTSYGIDNAGHDDASIWGGRADDAGRFHITLHGEELALDRIILDQGGEHWVASVDLEQLDQDGTWQLRRHFDRLRPGWNDLLLYDQPPAEPAPPVAAPVPRRARQREDPFADWRILVLIAAYRDPELPNTIASALAQAAYPEHVRFAICHQYDEATRDLLEPWADDPRFTVDAIPHTESRGCCWARHRTFELFDDEPYILQIDAHTRFAARWDVRYIDMLESTGAQLPLLTTYPPRYTIEDEGTVEYDLDAGVQRLFVAELRDDLTTLQRTSAVPYLHAPSPSPTLAAGQIFSRGSFCRDVAYDPDMYYAGEEISMAARAFTSGYDLFCPNENLIWHLYDHDHPKHWDDHDRHTEAHDTALARLRRLFTGPADALGRHGLGSVRPLVEFERAAEIRFPRNATAVAPSRPHRIVVTIDRSVIETRDDYECFLVVFLDADGHEVARRALHAPDVLDLSRSSVELHDLDGLDLDMADRYLIVPMTRLGRVGEIQLRSLGSRR